MKLFLLRVSEKLSRTAAVVTYISETISYGTRGRLGQD
jgi:hypothetical protein